jgi:aspartyl protease family protein
MRLLPPLFVLPFLFATQSYALDISVVGVFPGKAVLVVDGGSPKTYSAGDKINDDTKLVATDGSSATFLIDGKRETIALGQHVAKAGGSSESKRGVTLQADSQGHFVTLGQINGSTVKMIVDTGATNVALPAAEAARIGLPYKQGRRGMSNTANGVVPIYLIKLDSVRIGDVELHNVEASIHEGPLPITLLGMSFLNRTDMRREGDRMTLIKRY